MTAARRRADCDRAWEKAQQAERDLDDLYEHKFERKPHLWNRMLTLTRAVYEVQAMAFRCRRRQING